MHPRPFAVRLFLLAVMVACTSRTPSPALTPVRRVTAPHTALAPPAVPSLSPEATVSTDPYTSLDAPLARRTTAPAAGVDDASRPGFALHTGDYQIRFDPNAGGGLIISRPEYPISLVLRPLGADLNLLQDAPGVTEIDEQARVGVRLDGAAPWADFVLWLWVYPYNPGLIHYRLDLTPRGEPPAGAVDPEWTAVKTDTGEAAPAGYSAYAEPAPLAAPGVYGYAEALDSTLLYWIDRTRLNPFIALAHYAPGATPVRRGRHFGHNLSLSDLRRLPPGQTLTLYDSYLYLAEGQPEDEAGLFLRYLHQVSDIYDLIAHPAGDLPDWQSLAQETLRDLQDPDTWVELDGQRYWRAYVSDSRQSAEAITQLDVGLAAARYAARYGASDLSDPIVENALGILPDFYNANYGMFQNSGPLAISGNQSRGDTWYELGHALKAAEWGRLGSAAAAQLARDSQAAWISFAQTVGYQFPQFYTFTTWQGTGREPDAGGGYALYMLRLAELGCGAPCLQEAEAAVRAFPGFGFAFAYETHMTAMSALAAVELADQTGDATWLTYAYGPIANLMRLSWIYEVDYGPAAPARTFFGLAPTQRAGAITPKEQYEAWIYLDEFLRRAHGRIDPSVEKLVAEFRYHTLVTLADSLPPRLPDGLATQHPSAYETVRANRLDLFIPLEDMREGWDAWGVIGQEVYGAGMAPTFAALAYPEIAPGVTVYSGYPLAEIDEMTVTFAGVPGTFAPVVVTGVSQVLDAAGNRVATQAGDGSLQFQAEGGRAYELRPSSQSP